MYRLNLFLWDRFWAAPEYSRREAFWLWLAKRA